MEGVDAAEARAMVESYFQSHMKELTPDQVQSISQHTMSSSPLFLFALCNELRVQASWATLDESIQRYLGCESIAELFRIILARWATDYGWDKRGRKAANARETGASDRGNWVHEVLKAIAVSRRGLSHDEIMLFLEDAGFTEANGSAVLSSQWHLFLSCTCGPWGTSLFTG